MKINILAVVRDDDEKIEGSFVALEKVIAIQNEKTDRSIQKMVEAFKLMTRFPNQIGASTSDDQMHREIFSRISTTQDTQRDHQQHNMARGDNAYMSMTRLAKINFSRFSRENI